MKFVHRKGNRLCIVRWLLNAVFTSGLRVENLVYNLTRAICEPVRGFIDSSSIMRNIKQGFIRILVELTIRGFRTPPHYFYEYKNSEMRTIIQCAVKVLIVLFYFSLLGPC